jgi:GNAT superfamily N-acetyltransferase
VIRPARQDEAAVLTRLSFESKGYWPYPPAYFDIWKKELTITANYIKVNDVHVYELEQVVTGYYAIVELSKDTDVSGIMLKKGVWLEHMFIDPRHIGKGIGAKLFSHLYSRCIEKRITELGILADPNASGFYEKMGCRYVKEFPSTIRNRTTPYLVLKTGNDWN